LFCFPPKQLSDPTVVEKIIEVVHEAKKK